jgi:serine protease inhibitor
MLIRVRALLSLLLAAVPLLGCSDSTGPSRTPEPITELPRPLTAAEEQVISGSNAFGFELLKAVEAVRAPEDPNTVLSPLSASMALGMALVGAEGETFTSMRDALGFEGMSREEVYSSYGGLSDLLLDLDPKVEIQLANSAWSRQGFPFEPAFFDAVATHFNAIVQELDFSDPGAKDIINQWVQERTNGRIEEIVQEINPLGVLFLINAFYFRGDWTNQFKKGDTQPSPFHLPDGTEVDVPTMSGTISGVGFHWFENMRQLGELPYGGQAFGMIIVVPGPEETVDDLLANLDHATWDSWMGSLHYEKVSVRMPKYELDWVGILNEPLVAMGMGVAFDPDRAEFSRLSPVPGVFISRVQQKTYLSVDEEGTEAAASTSVGATPPAGPPQLLVDRPFLLAIRERLSGTVLFLGVIRDPR